MTWEAAGAIGEIVGAIAVVLTLGFLAIQIRNGSRSLVQQNLIAQSDAVAKGVELASHFRHTIAGDSELAAIWRKGQKGEPLDEDEMLRFRHLAMSWFELLSVVYITHLNSGRTSAAETAVNAQANNLKLQPGLRKLWEENPMLLDPAETGFGLAIESRLKQIDDEGGN